MNSTVSLLAALADPRRLRIIEVLAEKPRSVGVVAQLAGLRQPQASKDLQRLDKAGLVVSYRSGQRRIYALEVESLRILANLLDGLADVSDGHRVERETFDNHSLSRAAEMLAADREGWADDRVFTFQTMLAAAPEQVWRHLTEPDLLAFWWAPRDLVVSTVEFEAIPGGRVILEYQDADDATGTDGIVGRAQGTVDEVVPAELLKYRLSPLLPNGSMAFTGHYQLLLREDKGGSTKLDVQLRVSDSTVSSAEFIAGIELGWAQSLDRLVEAVTSETKKKDKK